MNDSRKNKIFQNLIKKIFTDIQPKFTFQLVSFCMILNCSFPSILVIKPPSTWNELFGELTQSKEILRKHQKSFKLDTGYRQNGKSQTGCSDSRKLRVKISKTVGSWRFEDTFKPRETPGRSQIVHYPFRKPSHLNGGCFGRGSTEGTAKDDVLLPSSLITNKVQLWFLIYHPCENMARQTGYFNIYVQPKWYVFQYIQFT